MQMPRYPVGLYNAYPRGSIFGDIGSFLGKAAGFVGGLATNPIGTIAGGVVSLLGAGSSPAAPAVLPTRSLTVPSGIPGVSVGVGGIPPLTLGPTATNANMFNLPFTNPFSPTGGGSTGVPTQYGGDTAAAIYAKQLKGYHLNKSTYVTRRGGQLMLHPKHSGLVRNRHMNPGNGRAARHALRRLHSFAKMARHIYRVVHPKPGKSHFVKKGKRK